MTPHDPTDLPPPVTDTVAFGEPAGRPRPWRRRNVVVGAATVAVLAASATGVALAADSPTPTPSGSATSPSVPGTPGHGKHDGSLGRFGMRMGGGLLGGMFGAVHGEVTVPKSGGGYQTVVLQNGTVSSVGSSTLTVKSADGFQATYDVPADALVNATRDGLASIKKGDEVSVVAQQKSGNDKALHVADLTSLKASRGGFGFGRGPGRPDLRAPAPGQSGDGSSSSQSSAFGV